MSVNCGKVLQMLVLIASLLLGLLLQGPRVQGYEDYEDISEEGGEDDYIDYDVVDDTEEAPVTSTTANDDEELKNNRIRRDQDEEAAVDTNTLSPEDLGEVKGALNQILSRISANNPFTPHSTTQSIDYNYYYSPTTTLIDLTTTITSTTPSYTVEETSTQTEDLINGSGTTNEEETVTSASILASDDNYNEDWPTRSSKIGHGIENNLDRVSSIKVLKQGDFFPTNFTITAMTERTPQIDIAKLLDIISGLANDFETNLTRKLNESVASMNIPTCTTPTPPTTTVLTTVTDEYDANYTGAVVAKCFVCGLDIPGIPQHAHCADAFAGDFLPLVPVDTSAKGKISRFRKYCKYANIQGYRTKMSQPRVIIGRWTGGCAVRWIDLSGVYTQRTCRNRMQPTMGLHYASKRMAKLEKSLWNLEDGCIASPVATLTPLSRAVSLYARFHACVCSGNWCNAARVRAPYRRIVLYTTLISGLGATWPV